MIISTRSSVTVYRFRPISDPGTSIDLEEAVAMSPGVQYDDPPPGGVSAGGLDPEGGAERGERALMIICAIPIGPRERRTRCHHRS
jgi:hypothetical protein